MANMAKVAARLLSLLSPQQRANKEKLLKNYFRIIDRKKTVKYKRQSRGAVPPKKAVLKISRKYTRVHP